MLSGTDLRQIAGRASSLWDRRVANYRQNEDEESRIALLSRWASVLETDIDGLIRKIGPSNCDFAEASQTIHLADLTPGSELPEWARLLPELLDTRRSQRTPSLQASPQPYQEPLWPLVEAALDRLQQTSGASYDLFTQSCIDRICWNLLERLSCVAGQTLQMEFRLFWSSFAAFSGSPSAASSTCYLAFVAELQNGGFDDILRRYPVLARLIATVCGNWINFWGTFLEHCRQEADDVVRILYGGTFAGKVVQITLPKPCYHSNGKHVVVVTFVSGHRAVYKPRELAMDHAFARFVHWSAETVGMPRCRTAQVVDRQDHGWAEFVDATTSVDGSFFYTSGVLLCLAYVLRGVDLHSGNVVPTATNPVLIDTETLLHPSIEKLVATADDDSVSVTGMIPIPGERRTAWCGLSFNLPRCTADQTVKWRNINTDAIDVCLEPVEAKARELSWRSGRCCSLTEQRSMIAEGFEGTYRRLASVKSLVAVEVRDCFRDATIGCVVNSSSIYQTLIDRSLHPLHLRDGATHSIFLWHLAVPLVRRRESAEQRWQLLTAELRALERLDFPRFTAIPTRVDLRCSDGVLYPGVLTSPPLEAVLERIERLCEMDLLSQRERINNAWRHFEA